MIIITAFFIKSCSMQLLLSCWIKQTPRSPSVVGCWNRGWKGRNNCMGISWIQALLREPNILWRDGENQSGNLCSTRNKMCTDNENFKTAQESINPFHDLLDSVEQFTKYRLDLSVKLNVLDAPDSEGIAKNFIFLMEFNFHRWW